MPVRDVDAFFRDYVFGFMLADVGREIKLARGGATGGNFLAALGLLCYTEVLGGLKRGTLARGNGRKNFDAFFGQLGSDYVSLAQTIDVYGVFRCGMAHEYLAKGRATISMLTGVELAGIAVADDGRLYFCVERYYEDFTDAAGSLRAQLVAEGAALPLGLR